MRRGTRGAFTPRLCFLQLSAEDDEEVWRIIEQIVAARARLHPAFQSPDKASTLSVKELRRWFESQAAERAAQSSSANARGETGLRKRGESENRPRGQGENGLQRQGENGLHRQAEKEVQGKGENGHQETRYGEKGSIEAALSDGESSDLDLEWAAAKEAALLGKEFGRAGIDEGKVERNEVPSEKRGEVEKASTAGKESAGGAEEAATKANKIVRRRKSVPSEDDLIAMVARLEENGGHSEGDGEDGNGKADGKPSNGNRGTNESEAAVNGNTASKDGSVSGGSEYMGPVGGEDRVVVYMTSVRAVSGMCFRSLGDCADSRCFGFRSFPKCVFRWSFLVFVALSVY